MDDLIKDFVDDVKAMAVRKGYCRTTAQKNEYALNYISYFFEVFADEKLRQQIKARMYDLREHSL